MHQRGAAEQIATNQGVDEASAAGLQLPGNVGNLLLGVGDAYRQTVAQPERADALGGGWSWVLGCQELPPGLAQDCARDAFDDVYSLFDPRTPDGFSLVSGVILDPPISSELSAVATWVASKLQGGSDSDWPEATGLRNEILGGTGCCG